MTDEALKPISWVPLLGEVQTVGEDLRFKGKVLPPVPATEPGSTPATDQPAFGIALSNRRLAGGDVVADVTFEQVTATLRVKSSFPMTRMPRSLHRRASVAT